VRYLYLLLTSCCALFAQGSDVLIHHTFDQDTEGWTTLGNVGSVRVDNGALALTYEVKAKLFCLAVLPATPEVARMGRLRFRVKTDYDTPLAVLLSEKKPGGGNYTAPLWSPANTWQLVELSAADFSASDGRNDPVDADGKLDLDQVEGIGIADVAQFFLGQPDNPDFPVIIARGSGTHTLWIDDFEILGGAAPTRSAMQIDRFDRGFLPWITMGGVQLKRADAGNPLGIPAMQASYQQMDARYGLMLRRLSGIDIAKAERLAFELASEHEATLIVSLETKKGERYNLTIYPPGKREIFHVSLKFSDFEGKGTLDPAQLKSLAITDISAAGGGTEQANTIWIGNVEGRK
jgi:hypothetical protein